MTYRDVIAWRWDNVAIPGDIVPFMTRSTHCVPDVSRHHSKTHVLPSPTQAVGKREGERVKERAPEFGWKREKNESCAPWWASEGSELCVTPARLLGLRGGPALLLPEWRGEPFVEKTLTYI